MSTRLKIGYVSPDFKTHPVGNFIEPILKNHDRSSIEVYCYGEVQKPDDLTKRIQSLADHWFSTVGLSDQEVIQQIEQDQIDILVDLAGHTENNRLPIFFAKSAPIQVSYLGYFATTGIPTIDYWITDHCLHPLDTNEKTVEKIWRLPRSYIAYKPHSEAPDIAPLPALSSSNITFGSFNNFSKLNAPLLSLWAKILNALPNACLLVKTNNHNLEDPQERTSIEDLFQKQGIDPKRITLISFESLSDDYLALYNKIDIHLDTFPYNGCTTTCDALSMGVPVLTLAGSRKIERMGYSLLQALGLEDWISHSPEEYIQKAIKFAQDREKLAELRSTLRQRLLQSELGNVRGLTEALEEAYGQMYAENLAKKLSAVKLEDPLSFYSHYLEKLCPHLEKYDQLLKVGNSTNWENPSTLIEWNNIAVITLIEAEETNNLTTRKHLLNNALAILQKGQSHPLCAAHLALIYAFLGNYAVAWKLAIATFIKTLQPTSDPKKGLIYLSSTSRSLFVKQGGLVTLLSAEDGRQQALLLCIEALCQSQFCFYNQQGRESLQLATQVAPQTVITNLQLGIAHLHVERAEGLFYLQRAIELAPDNVSSIQALYLAYRNLSQMEIAQIWHQTRASDFNPHSLEWMWTQLPYSSPFTYVPFDNLLLAVEANFKSIVTAVLLAQGDWFEAEMELWRTYLKPGMTVIDIGANVGVYTFSAAQKVGAQGKVIAIEPFQDCITCLEETVRINQLPWVKIYAGAASNYDGSARLSLHSSSELNEVISDNLYEPSSNQTFPINCFTLDSLLEKENLTQVDWLKIDAEGHEMQVLLGAKTLLTRFTPHILYENIAGVQSSNFAVSEYLCSRGYQLYYYRPYLQELVPVQKIEEIAGHLNLIAIYPKQKQD
jgi:FkbM family methyltransferase